MIPLRDSVQSATYPYMTKALVAANIAVFIFQLSLSNQELGQLFQLFGVVPALFTRLSLLQLFATLFPSISLFSAVFLHGSLLHLLGNMLYLWIFGDNVEDKLGHIGFLVFYFTTGIIGSLAHILANPASPIPTIGASGSIAGVLGAYLVFFPKAKVQALIPLIFIFTVMRIRAVYFLFLWFAIQLLNGITVLATGAQAVAWWAHIGGFIAGAVLAVYFKFWISEGSPGTI